MTTAPVTVNRVTTNAQWAALMINAVGAQPTNNNVQNVMRWMAAENPPSNWSNRNNPLNASLNTAATDGTGSYSDLITGANNTAAMISAGNKGGAIGSGIYNALMNNAPADQFSMAVIDSPWSSNHYGVAASGANAPFPGRLANYLSTIPIPGTVQASNQGNTTAGAQQASATQTGCSSKPAGLTFPGVFGVGKWSLSACNGKALMAGLSLVAGGLIFLAGVSFLLKGELMSAAVPAAPAPARIKSAG